jgi:hypothetical protein
MFDRVPMLGQVGITEQAGFGGPAWGVNTPLNPNVRFPAPYGAPATTEENVGRWLCPDGMERVLTEAQALAMGCTRRNLVNMMGQTADDTLGRWLCPDGTERVLTGAQARAMGCRRVSMMGQAGTPGSPGSPGGPPVGGGAPTVSVSPTVHNGGFTQPFNQFEQFQFFQPYWGYPQYPQYPYPPQQQGRMICRKLEEASEAEGRDVFECQTEQVARPASYAYYTYPIQPMSWWY